MGRWPQLGTSNDAAVFVAFVDPVNSPKHPCKGAGMFYSRVINGHAVAASALLDSACLLGCMLEHAPARKTE